MSILISTPLLAAIDFIFEKCRRAAEMAQPLKIEEKPKIEEKCHQLGPLQFISAWVAPESLDSCDRPVRDGLILALSKDHDCRGLLEFRLLMESKGHETRCVFFKSRPRVSLGCFVLTPSQISRESQEQPLLFKYAPNLPGLSCYIPF